MEEQVSVTWGKREKVSKEARKKSTRKKSRTAEK
jgi:hypothetical protein